MEGYQTLTPTLRADIDVGFDKAIAELKSCEPNAFANMQIEALEMYKRLIHGLPDGFPIPVNRN